MTPTRPPAEELARAREIVEADVLARDLAVALVDGIRGYTIEFSSDQAAHAADYEIVAAKIATALATARAEGIAAGIAGERDRCARAICPRCAKGEAREKHYHILDGAQRLCFAADIFYDDALLADTPDQPAAARIDDAGVEGPPPCMPVCVCEGGKPETPACPVWTWARDHAACNDRWDRTCHTPTERTTDGP